MRPHLSVLSLSMTLLMTVVLLSACRAQVDDAEQDKAKAMEKILLETLKKENVELDLKNKTLTIPVVVNRPTSDLEYVLIHARGKKHEALLATLSKPSVIQTGLLALGLENGKNAWFKDKEPPPSQEELEQGVDPYIVMPPTGPKLFMTVKYEDEEGEKVERPIEELLFDWGANKPVRDNSWIFLGGRMAQLYRGEPEVFMADFEGNLISVCYMHPANHLLTMDHERARDQMNWTVAPDCPPPGTEMTLTFHTTKPKIVADRESRKDKESDPSERPERKGPPKKDKKEDRPE